MADGLSGAVLAAARALVANHFPRAGGGEQSRLAWLLVGTDAGRAELYLRAQALPGFKAWNKTDRDSISDLSEMEMLALQSLMDRRAQLESMLSNIMRKTSETSNQIIGNLK